MGEQMRNVAEVRLLGANVAMERNGVHGSN